MKRLLLAAVLAVASTAAMAGGWQHGKVQLPTLPTVVCPPNYGQSLSFTPLFNPVVVAPVANAPFATTANALWLPAVAECNGFPKGSWCLETVERAVLDLTPAPPPVAPFVAPPVVVKPENG